MNNFHLNSIAVWVITPKGIPLGLKIQKALKNATLLVSNTLGELRCDSGTTRRFSGLSKEIGQRFKDFSGHIFIFSTGIAVRIIAPLLESKTIDPAVVVVDDAGRFAISLVSGHIGGANRLAQQTADLLGAVAVITTATDTNHLPAIDMMAKDRGLHIETPENIRHINMAILKGGPIAVDDRFNYLGTNLHSCFQKRAIASVEPVSSVFCSYFTRPVPRETLVLRPRVLSVGIGCNRGTGCQEIKDFLVSVFETQGLSVKSIGKIATTDVKADEPGILQLSRTMGIPIDFYGKEALNSVKNIQTPSQMVEKHLGVKSVCEAAAILSANMHTLIVTKHKNRDVTVAVAI